MHKHDFIVGICYCILFLKEINFYLARIYKMNQKDSISNELLFWSFYSSRSPEIKVSWFPKNMKQLIWFL